jgi:N-methylhydantoinase B
LYQEGVIVPPVKLIEAGRTNEALLALFCRNVRTPEERRGDLEAQLAANEVGVRRLRELLDAHGAGAVRARIEAARAQSERATRELLATLPAGEYPFEDWLDDDGCGGRELAIRLTVTVGEGRVRFDFTGTAPQSRGPLNAPLAVPEEVPFNAGCFAPIEVVAPDGSLVNARPPAAVAGGNVETSQRIVDVALGALAAALPGRIPAASQGTMSAAGPGVPAPARFRRRGGAPRRRWAGARSRAARRCPGHAARRAAAPRAVRPGGGPARSPRTEPARSAGRRAAPPPSGQDDAGRSRRHAGPH